MTITKSSNRHINCPHYRYRKTYKLADGRNKCQRCKHRFTWRKQTSRLSTSVFKEIARLFWLLVPAERAAKDLGLNRKTVQKYYQLLRQRIAEEDDKDALSLSGEIEVDESYLEAIKRASVDEGLEERFRFLVYLNGRVLCAFLSPKMFSKGHYKRPLRIM